MLKKIISWMCLVLLGLQTSFADSGVRLKELVEVQGVRGNQLFGYGLVVGLNGTGDKTQTVFTGQSLTNMLDKLGIVPSKISKFGLSTSGSEMKVKNVAAVLVTAELSPFVRSGSKIDVLLSSIGDCKSLEGGTLVMTPLQGADGKVYAVAQGPVSIGGLSTNTTTPMYPTVGHVPSGAYVEQEVKAEFVQDGKLTLALRDPDFTTTSHIVDAINAKFPASAKAWDSGSVLVSLPQKFQSNPIQFVSELEQVTAESDSPAKIVINERTGTIVTGEHVSISEVAVSHGTLTVNIRPEGPAGGGTAGNTAEEDKQSRVMVMKDSVSVGQVAKNLASLGATPSDMISIFQAMKRAGALKAKLEIM